MKKYKLIHDLPFAKAGEELYIERHEDGGYFTLYKDLDKMSVGDLHEGYIEDFDEWFKEAVEEFYFINEKGFVSTLPKNYIHADIHLRQAIGNHFKTEEETERHINYLKAKEIIKQDTKGFKPNWNNEGEKKFFGSWNFQRKEVYWDYEYINKYVEIYFKTNEDIEESFEKHSEEWKTYLTYEK